MPEVGLLGSPPSRGISVASEILIISEKHGWSSINSIGPNTCNDAVGELRDIGGDHWLRCAFRGEAGGPLRPVAGKNEIYRGQSISSDVKIMLRDPLPNVRGEDVFVDDEALPLLLNDSVGETILT